MKFEQDELINSTEPSCMQSPDMDRKNNILRQTPFADATNTKNGDQQVDPLHELVATPVPPNCHLSKPTTTEQIMVKRAKRRARYAKAHPIQKRTRKDSAMSSQ